MPAAKKNSKRTRKSTQKRENKFPIDRDKNVPFLLLSIAYNYTACDRRLTQRGTVPAVPFFLDDMGSGVLPRGFHIPVKKLIEALESGIEFLLLSSFST